MAQHLRVLFIIAVSVSLVAANFHIKTDAAQLDNRSVRVGTSLAGATTTYRFKFNIQSVANLGSVEFEFCSNSPLVGTPCTAPVGFNASSAVLSSQTGETGFAIDPSSTANRIVLSRPASLSSAVTATYNFTNIVNPANNGTYYVRLGTFATTDGTGARTDYGGLVFAMNSRLSINTYVPPYLTFCAGVTVAGDCSSVSGQFIGFGELSTQQTKYLTSQFAGATNDAGGYSTFVTGLTMTSGTNVIPALNTPQPSILGVSQFGMNLRANSNPAVGANPSGIGTSTIQSDFAQPNIFTFKNQLVTTSTTSTDFNLFTVSYVVNVSSAQPPGVYNTTLTYIATAAF